MGGVLAILIRFVDDQYSIHQRLICMQLLAKSIAEELAREIITILQAHYKALPGSLIGAMHEGSAVNTVAMNTVSIVYPNILDVGCMSHTIDHVGDKFLTPLLDEFVTAWVQMFSHTGSLKSRLQWSNRVGFNVRLLSKGVFTLHQKSNRIRTGLKPDRGNAHSSRFSCNRSSTLCLRMSRDCHARAVLLVKNGSSTIDNRDASLPSMVPRRVAVLLVLLWAFLRLRRTHRALSLQGKKVLA